MFDLQSTTGSIDRDQTRAAPGLKEFKIERDRIKMDSLEEASFGKLSCKIH